MLWTIGLLFVFLIDFCSAHRRQGNDAFTFGEEQRKVFHVVVANKRTIGIYLSLDVDACGAVKGQVNSFFHFLSYPFFQHDGDAVNIDVSILKCDVSVVEFDVSTVNIDVSAGDCCYDRLLNADQQSTLSESVDNRTEAQDFENISYFVNTEKTRNSTRTTKKTSSDSKRRSKALDSPKKETIEAPGAVSKTVISEPKIEKASSPSCHIAQQLQIEQTPEEKADRRGHEFRIGFIVTSIVYVVFIDIHAIVNTVIVVM
ncbi:hypothetical protein QR680_004136 [Steinernema hermaphroditum]|uniref:ZP domain-containing protein n=1 Tax=Steinernema hermaphroditum TaxID=289476 RepID=A0AA39LT87_9BILA|nr:hypothetical protein QR680_004136 [Steinernema hermaphroditum]